MRYSFFPEPTLHSHHLHFNHYFLEQSLQGNETNWFWLVLKLHPKYLKDVQRAQIWRNSDLWVPATRVLSPSTCAFCGSLHLFLLVFSADHFPWQAGLTVLPTVLGIDEMETFSPLPSHACPLFSLKDSAGRNNPSLSWGCWGHWRNCRAFISCPGTLGSSQLNLLLQSF